jgi:putative Mg2+ transporter-C (MgtC) family protein
MELLEFTGNVVLALVLGALIGIERQFRQHPAGLRTNALVSVGAALFVTLTRLIGDPNNQTRIAAYIVVGIGFLGGGVISKDGRNVRGLTTAAAVWCSAAVGTLAGAGHGYHAAVGTGFVLIVLVGLLPLDDRVASLHRRLGAKKARYQINVVCGGEECDFVHESILGLAKAQPSFTVNAVRLEKQAEKKRVVMIADVTTRPENDAAMQELVGRLLNQAGVLAASWDKHSPATE